MAANSYVGVSACQHVLGVRYNVVIGTRRCNFQEESAATAFTGNDWPTDPIGPKAWADDSRAAISSVRAFAVADLAHDRVHVEEIPDLGESVVFKVIQSEF